MTQEKLRAALVETAAREAALERAVEGKQRQLVLLVKDRDRLSRAVNPSSSSPSPSPSSLRPGASTPASPAGTPVKQAPVAGTPPRRRALTPSTVGTPSSSAADRSISSASSSPATPRRCSAESCVLRIARLEHQLAEAQRAERESRGAQLKAEAELVALRASNRQASRRAERAEDSAKAARAMGDFMRVVSLSPGMELS